jgi:hypothetical protein
MTKLVRCRRCGAMFVPQHPIERVGWWRLCPRCRGPLPPTGGSVIERWIDGAAIAAMGGEA